MQMHTWMRACMLAAVIVSTSLYASTSTDNITAKLAKTLPEMSIDAISQSPLPGLYQVNTGANIIYVSEDARYIISGEIIDLKNDRENITELARKSARVKVLQEVVKHDAISFAPENPAYRIVVFTDVDCGYCRKFHDNVAELNKMGIAVDYLAFPRGGPSSRGFDKMVSIWCSKNRKDSLTQAKQGKAIKEQVCIKHDVDNQFKLGLKMGIHGTPTMILEDGTMVPGYLAPDKLLELLKQTS